MDVKTIQTTAENILVIKITSFGNMIITPRDIFKHVVKVRL
jgi:hypothetical protein